MFRRGSISPIPKPNAREIVEVGEILTLDDIIALVEISATFKHKLFGYVSDFIVTHKSLLLNAISHKEKKAKEEQNK